MVIPRPTWVSTFFVHLESFASAQAHRQLFDTKQDKITATGVTNLLTAPALAGGQPGTKPVGDFATSAQGAKADSAYQKPTGGIPKTDLAAAVQTSLTNADSALQSFTETDPTVPAWAKSASKPTYTASEVGAAAVGHTHDDKQNSLNRTVGSNDDATGTVTDTGGNLSVPIPVTVVAPAATARAGTTSNHVVITAIPVPIGEPNYILFVSSGANRWNK